MNWLFPRGRLTVLGRRSYFARVKFFHPVFQVAVLAAVALVIAAPLRAQPGRASNYGPNNHTAFRDSDDRPKSKATGTEKDGVYTESEGQRNTWFSFSKPRGKTPEEQMAYATRLADAGETKAAGKAWRILVQTWPRSAQAAPAQQRYAETLVKRNKAADAFEAYEVLLDRYVGSFDYDEVIQAIFDLGKTQLEARTGKFLGLGGWKAPERAIPMFESVLKNAPRWQGAAEAQHLIGTAHEMNDDKELAIVAYMSTEHRHPGSPFAEKSALGRVRLLNALSEETPNDAEGLDQAYAASALFLQNYPRSTDAVQVMAWRDGLYARIAKAAFDRAAFYDKVSRKPSAALASYRNFVSLHPRSVWAPVAQARIDQLAPTVNPATAP